MNASEALHTRDLAQRLSEAAATIKALLSGEIPDRVCGPAPDDFNNLLSVILGYSGLLAAELKPGDPMREDLLEIKTAGERAAALTQQLLAFSRQQVLQPRVVDLNQVVGSMEKMLRRLIGEDVDLTVVPAQRARKGHGTGALHGLRHRSPQRGDHLALQRAGKGHLVQDLPSRRRARQRKGPVTASGARGCVARRRSFCWRTKRAYASWCAPSCSGTDIA